MAQRRPFSSTLKRTTLTNTSDCTMNQQKNKGHAACYFCREGGFLGFRNLQAGKGASASLIIDRKHEGWPGIPHGGVGMTAFLELADMMEGVLQKHPLRADFRFGGDAISISDEIGVSIESRGGVMWGELTKLQGKAPYLHASLRPASSVELEEEGASLMELVKKPVRLRNSFVIPVFSERIIFKTEFQSAGIQRVFELNETSDGDSYMVCYHRGTNGALACEEMNTLGEERVHPGALLAMLDETLGWAGFLEVWQGGVTVNLSAGFLRPVGVRERIMAVGVCAGFKGRHRKKIVSCLGGIFALAGEDMTPLVYASGRWLTDPEYKRKMLRYVIP